MTDVEAQKLVHSLVSAYPAAMSALSPVARERTCAVYRRMLIDLDSRAAATAVQRLIASNQFMPTVAEIRAAVLESESGCVRPAGDAWGDVVRAVHRYGAYQTPAFDDPNTERTVRAMGWVALCCSENQIADRARFIQLYEQVTSAERHELQMPESARKALPIALTRGPTAIGAAIHNLLTATTTNAQPMTDEEHAELKELARRIADNPDAAAEAERIREAQQVP